MTISARRRFGLAVGASIFALLLGVGASGQSGEGSPSAQGGAVALSLTGDVTNSLALSLDALRHMPRRTVRVKNEHAQEEEVYEGVPLAALLRQAGVPAGAQIRGKAMATYVLAQGADGYQVLFSLPELDSDFQDSQVLVADTFEGKPINDKLGPFGWWRLRTSDPRGGCACLSPSR